MARKPTVDVEAVMRMLRNGESTQAVAQAFGVSRQAIDLYRRKLLAAGGVQRSRAEKPPAPGREASGTQNAENPRVFPGNGGTDGIVASEIPLEGMIDLMIAAFASLRRVPELEAELAACKRRLEEASRRIELLEQSAGRRSLQESRWRDVLGPDGEQGRPTGA